jgi:hypothetical protein
MRWVCVALCACGRWGFDRVADAPPPAYVQSNVFYDTGTTSSSVAFSKATSPGNLIVVTTGSTTSPPAAISDTAGNTYVNVIAYMNDDNGSWGHVWYATNITGGPDTISVSDVGSGNHTVAILEYADAVALDSAHSGAGTGTAQTSGDAFTSSASDLLVGFTHYPGGATWTPDAAYTIREVSQYDQVVDGLAGPPGPYAVTFTTATSITWDAHVIAFTPR